MTNLAMEKRTIYHSDPASPTIISIEPNLPCFYCEQSANAALTVMVFRDTNGDDSENATGEWLIKPVCGTCAVEVSASYARRED